MTSDIMKFAKLQIGSRIPQSTEGSILFIDSDLRLGQDNDKLFWDNTNKRLGIGTATPATELEVNGDILLPNAGKLYLDRLSDLDTYITSAQEGRITYVSSSGYHLFTGNLQNDKGIIMTSTGPAINFYSLGGAGLSADARWDHIKINAPVEVGRQFIIANSGNQDFTHPVQTNPTLFIHKDGDPYYDHTVRDDWIGFTHDDTDGLITTGAGDLKLSPAEDVNLSPTGDVIINDAILQINDDAIDTQGNPVINISLLEVTTIGPYHDATPIDLDAHITLDPDRYFYLRDTAIHIASLDDGHMDLTADTMVDINTPITYISGDLGIGTATPSVKLDVAGTMKITNTATSTPLRVDGHANNNFLQLIANGTIKSYFGWSSVGDDGFSVLASDGSTQLFKVTEAGKVGIGTTTPGAALHVVGGNIRTIATKTNDYTILTTDYTILADATSNTVDITLPAAPTTGQIFNIKCINDTNVVTLARNGNNIDGDAADIILIEDETVTVQSDGTDWWII